MVDLISEEAPEPTRAIPPVQAPSRSMADLYSEETPEPAKTIPPAQAQKSLFELPESMKDYESSL